MFFSIRRYARYSGLNDYPPKTSAHVLLDDGQFSIGEATTTFKIDAIIRCLRLPQLSEKKLRRLPKVVRVILEEFK